MNNSISASISANRYLFTHSLAYEMPEKTKTIYIIAEAFNLIPILSILTSYKKLKGSAKRNKSYHKAQKDHGAFASRMYDVKFSALSIAMHAINTIGLGILILPIRLLATYMKKCDEKEGKTFNNPHFVSDEQINMLIRYQNNTQKTYEDNVTEDTKYNADLKKFMEDNQVANIRCELKYSHLCPDNFSKLNDDKINDIIIRGRKNPPTERTIPKYIKGVSRPADRYLKFFENNRITQT